MFLIRLLALDLENFYIGFYLFVMNEEKLKNVFIETLHIMYIFISGMYLLMYSLSYLPVIDIYLPIYSFRNSVLSILI